MSKREPLFKDTQLFGWDSEPATERESTFFYNDAITAAEARRDQQRGEGAVRLAIAIVCAIGLGLAGLLQLVHVVAH